MRFLFLNIDKDVKARFALSLPLNRQLQKLNKLKNQMVGLKKITDYRILRPLSADLVFVLKYTIMSNPQWCSNAFGSCMYLYVLPKYVTHAR